MKKAGQLLAVLTAASVLLSGCEKLKDVTTTSVYVSKNGVVTEAIVEDYSKDDDYTEDELKVFVEDDIKKFTEERGDADSVKLEKCRLSCCRSFRPNSEKGLRKISLLQIRAATQADLFR